MVGGGASLDSLNLPDSLLSALLKAHAIQRVIWAPSVAPFRKHYG